MNRSPLHRPLFWAAAIAPIMAWCAAASAQSRSTKQLHDEGRRLLLEKKFPEACDKLAQAFKDFRSVRYHLDLAECIAAAGDPVRAWLEYLDAEQAAYDLKMPADAEQAMKAARALDPRPKQIVVIPPPGTTPDDNLRLTVDGASEAFEAVLPKKDGDHPIEVGGPRKNPWRAMVHLPDDGPSVTVRVPRLEDAPVGPTVSCLPCPDCKTSKLFLYTSIASGIALVGSAVWYFAERSSAEAEHDRYRQSTSPADIAEARVNTEQLRVMQGVAEGAAIGSGVIALVSGVAFAVVNLTAQPTQVAVPPRQGGLPRLHQVGVSMESAYRGATLQWSF